MDVPRRWSCISAHFRCVQRSAGSSGCTQSNSK